MTENNLWQAVLNQFEINLNSTNFETWFKNTHAQKEGGTIIVSTPNSFVKEWLENKYRDEVKKVVRSLDPEVEKVEFSVDNELAARPAEGPVETNDQQDGQRRLRVFNRDEQTGLNQAYTFGNFVVGGFNELAHAAAMAVAEEPGIRYNPLFLYGRVGLGKTHLLQAIGNKVARQDPRRLKIRYLASENFASDIISAIQNFTIADLKNKFKQVDVLIVDDIQFIAGKEKTQEEFFHIFNTLYQKNKQIVLSSDRPPKAISSLAKRLRSRFEGGMTADISYPDLETRMAILKTKSQAQESELSDDMCEYLARNIKTNIRELEGALNRVVMFRRTKSVDLDIDKVKELVNDFTLGRQEKLTAQKILNGVSEYYNIGKELILSPSRKKEVVRPRQVAMLLMRQELESSYPSIGRSLGGRDHTTAIYACRKMNKKLKEDEEFQRELNIIKMRFLNV